MNTLCVQISTELKRERGGRVGPAVLKEGEGAMVLRRPLSARCSSKLSRGAADVGPERALTTARYSSVAVAVRHGSISRLETPQRSARSSRGRYLLLLYLR